MTATTRDTYHYHDRGALSAGSPWPWYSLFSAQGHLSIAVACGLWSSPLDEHLGAQAGESRTHREYKDRAKS